MDPDTAQVKTNPGRLVPADKVREEPAMHLTVLAVPGCPNAELLEQRLMQVLGGRHDVTFSRHEISDQDQATRRGMHGSPTVLVDGIDPFAQLGQHASVSCRLYRDGHGPIEGAPSVRQLREAIRHPVTVVADTDGGIWLDALGRGGRGRLAPAERGLRTTHQAVVRSFAATGNPPGAEALDDAAGPFDSSQILSELAEGDYLCLDQAGRIRPPTRSPQQLRHTQSRSPRGLPHTPCAPSMPWGYQTCWASLARSLQWANGTGMMPVTEEQQPPRLRRRARTG
jgi:hypothetical protein